MMVVHSLKSFLHQSIYILGDVTSHTCTRACVTTFIRQVPIAIILGLAIIQGAAGLKAARRDSTPTYRNT